MEALAVVEVKRSILNSLMYMMECGYVLPVLAQVENWTHQGIDQSLIRYFIVEVIKINFTI